MDGNMAVTDTWLKSNHKKTRSTTSEKVDRDGLSVRVSPKGKLTFTMRYLYNGSPKRLDIGSYPLMPLKEARVEGQRLRRKLEQGHDPKIVNLVEKQAIMDAHSLEDMFSLWHNAVGENKESGHQIKRTFEIHVFPKIGKLPVRDITLHQWLDILETLAKDKPFIASRILTNAKQLLKWGVKRQLLEFNYLAGIQAKEDLQVKKVAGSRALTDSEIQGVWLAIDESRMAPRNKLFVKLCLIYGCRNGELRLAKKDHFDFETRIWIVPSQNHKMGRMSKKAIVRPIIDKTEPLIKDLISKSGDSEYLMPSEDINQPLTANFGLSLPYGIMQWLRKHQNIELPHFSLHDLRRTARTNFSTLTQPHIAEIMLGHSLGGVWQVYDQHDYLKEQSLAYEAWCERLFSLVGDGMHKSL